MEKIEPTKAEFKQFMDFWFTVHPPTVTVKQMLRCLGFDWPEPDYSDISLCPLLKPEKSLDDYRKEEMQCKEIEPMSRKPRAATWKRKVWHNSERVADWLNILTKKEIDGKWYVEVAALRVLGQTTKESWQRLREKYKPEIRFLDDEKMKEYTNDAGRLMPRACVVELESILEQV